MPLSPKSPKPKTTYKRCLPFSPRTSTPPSSRLWSNSPPALNHSPTRKCWRRSWTCYTESLSPSEDHRPSSPPTNSRLRLTTKKSSLKRRMKSKPWKLKPSISKDNSPALKRRLLTLKLSSSPELTTALNSKRPLITKTLHMMNTAKFTKIWWRNSKRNRLPAEKLSTSWEALNSLDTFLTEWTRIE